MSTKFYIAKIKADSKKIDFSFLEYNEEQKKIGYKFFENDIVLNKRNEKLSFILSALNAIILYYIKHKKEYNYLLTKVVKKYREKFGIDKISFKKYGLLFFEIDNIKNIKEIVCYHSIMEIFKDTPFFDVIKN
ncbi:MAG: hypothetical protein NZZ41_07120, partial [Candidatus Dojkabacteria bacterium]|nr:hypothetical protein [Candidatus Dojkabacteria bacterium]